MVADRLSAMDVAFLHVEDERNRAHLVGIETFDGPVPDFEEFRKAIERRLPALPRFRQKIVSVPFSLNRPAWADDDRFDLANHLGRVTVAAPGEQAQLNALCDSMMAESMNMDRPLWTIDLVDGLAGGRFALAIKVHHCMVDGLSIVDMLATLLDVHPDAPPPAEVAWSPRPTPSKVGLLGEGLSDLLLPPLWALGRGLVWPPRLWSGCRALGVLAGRVRRLVGAMGSAPHTSFNSGEAGTGRRTAWLEVPLVELKELRAGLGTTINNVVLAAVSGAIHRYLARNGESVEAFHAFVPVSVRAESERGSFGNRIGLTFPRLPVDEPHTAARVRGIIDSVGRQDQLQQAQDTAELIRVGDGVPPVLSAVLNRFIQFKAGLFNLTITNVPGPATPLYFCGRPMRQILGSAPLTKRHAVTIAGLSYNGTMFFSVTTDPARLPDGWTLINDLRDEFAALRALAQGVASGR